MNVFNTILEHKIFYILLLVVVLTNVVCIVYLVLKERKQDKQEIEDLVKDIKNRKPREINEEIIEQEPSLTEEVKEEDNMDNTGKLEIEKVLEKMQKDLEATPEEVITTFEQEQEDKSIISYQELLSAMKRTPKEEIEVKESKEEIEVIDIDDKEIEVNKVESVKGYEDNDEKVEVIDFKEDIKDKLEGKAKESYKQKEFKNTEIISPIFGKMNPVEEEYPKVPLITREDEVEITIDETPKRSDRYDTSLDVGPLAEEMRKNDEFLRSLKEFRNNL